MPFYKIDGGVMRSSKGKKSVVFHGTDHDCAVEKYRQNLIDRTPDAFAIPAREDRSIPKVIYYIREGGGHYYATENGKSVMKAVPTTYIVWNGEKILGKFDDFKFLKAKHPTAEFLSKDWRKVWLVWKAWKEEHR